MQEYTVEDYLLEKLLMNFNRYFSGTELADEFNVSRNAVWKAVNGLREQGYQIESSSKGYRLTKLDQGLDARQIKYRLTPTWENIAIQTFKEVTSTNDLAKQFAIEHPGQEALIVSESQTKGRGRSGRDFYSQLSNGLYFSLALVPKGIDIRYIPFYTIAAAAAMVEAIREELGMELQVKWVNDLFYKKRKVAGILSEAISDLENQDISAVVVGIGINIAGTFDNATADVQNVAGTLFEKLPHDLNLNQLMRTFLIKFGKYHENIPAKEFMSTYQNSLLGINQEVSFTRNKVEHRGVIKGINGDGHLLVEKEYGEIMELFGQDIHFSSQQFI